jgi:hypothetical protein
MTVEDAEKAGVVFEIQVLEEDADVHGNLCASGDDMLDRQMEAQVIRRLKHDDLWAWCTVRVVASFDDETGDDYLGCCSYKDEREFREAGGYYPQMQQEALHRLIANLNARELRWANGTFEKYDGTEETVAYAGE